MLFCAFFLTLCLSCEQRFLSILPCFERDIFVPVRACYSPARGHMHTRVQVLCYMDSASKQRMYADTHATRIHLGGTHTAHGTQHSATPDQSGRVLGELLSELNLPLTPEGNIVLVSSLADLCFAYRRWRRRRTTGLDFSMASKVNRCRASRKASSQWRKR